MAKSKKKKLKKLDQKGPSSDAGENQTLARASLGLDLKKTLILAAIVLGIELLIYFKLS